ncbi:hypothetical protein LJC68_05095 [Bacteroidales bacterium OttesenSCG-928-B11]|nr:hypothetical protein [Bacteroidales bacterium OttesenSCG-928-C03]MDL2312233.1 hypothetical protein [Bacteroidales bacterium OttesenSCG-928-B11]
MSIFSVNKHEKREFKYKPRFHEPDGGIKGECGEIDINKMADRIHRSWSSKRKAKRKVSGMNYTFLIVLAIIIIVAFLINKLFL